MKIKELFFRMFLLAMVVPALISCGGDSGGSDSADAVRYWHQIDWQDADGGIYSDFIYEGLTPSCSNSPDSQSADFAFFSRNGSENKLVVYFHGGGACWHENNCIEETTYSYEMQYFENEPILDLISNGQGKDLGYSGIFDFTNDNNPFKDWSFVYIPYCTGDLHWGANDYTYDGKIIRHRGQVNFRLVLEWLKENYPDAPEKIFVTGISGGAYGAIFNFPHIREAFPDSDFYMLGDAGNGVITPDFKTSGLPNWKAQLPVAGDFNYFSTKDIEDLDIAELYHAIANYYIDTPFAQYTSAWDENQAYFYNVMSNITDPGEDGAIWDDITKGKVWCEWHEEMLVNRKTTVSEVEKGDGTYRYFITPGDVHTILMFNEFYTVTSKSIKLTEWLGAMLSGVAFVDVKCTGTCGRPEEDCLAECVDPE